MELGQLEQVGLEVEVDDDEVDMAETPAAAAETLAPAWNDVCKIHRIVSFLCIDQQTVHTPCTIHISLLYVIQQQCQSTEDSELVSE